MTSRFHALIQFADGHYEHFGIDDPDEAPITVKTAVDLAMTTMVDMWVINEADKARGKLYVFLLIDTTPLSECIKHVERHEQAELARLLAKYPDVKLQ